MTGLKRILNSSAALVALAAVVAISGIRFVGGIDGTFYATSLVVLAVALILKTGVEDAADKLGANFGVQAHAKSQAFLADVVKQTMNAIPEFIRNIDEMISKSGADRSVDDARHASHMKDLDERLRALRDLQASMRGDPPKKPDPS